MNVVDKFCKPLIFKSIDQNYFQDCVRKLSKIICNFDGYNDDVVSIYVDMELEEKYIRHISHWCDCDEKLVASDEVIPDPRNYTQETFNEFVKKYIENLKELAALPEEKRHPKVQNNKNNTQINKQAMDIKKQKHNSYPHHVDIHVIGEHDLDNSFFRYESAKDEFDYWKQTHPDCIPIGFCDEAYKVRVNEKHIAFVYEDENGNRYYIHVPTEWKGLDIA